MLLCSICCPCSLLLILSSILFCLLWFSLSIFIQSIISPLLVYQLYFYFFLLFKNDFPRVCNMHSQLIHAYFQIILYHFIRSASTLSDKILLIPPPLCPLYHCCYLFHLYLIYTYIYTYVCSCVCVYIYIWVYIIKCIVTSLNKLLTVTSLKNE